MNLITMTACNRPEYTRQVLDALAKCHGIERFQLGISVDPGNEEVKQFICRRAPGNRIGYKFNKEKLGCNLNTCQVMDMAAKNHDFWIHLEDDTVPSPDFLDYMEWARNHYADDPKVFSIGSFNREAPSFDETYAVRKRSQFTCWAFGIWRHSWMKVREQVVATAGDSCKSWDTIINDYIVSQGLVEVHPILSRCQNIGAVGGVHVPSAEWHAQHHHSNHVADCPAGPYFEK